MVGPSTMVGPSVGADDGRPPPSPSTSPSTSPSPSPSASSAVGLISGGNSNALDLYVRGCVKLFLKVMVKIDLFFTVYSNSKSARIGLFCECIGRTSKIFSCSFLCGPL